MTVYFILQAIDCSIECLLILINILINIKHELTSDVLEHKGRASQCTNETVQKNLSFLKVV